MSSTLSSEVSNLVVTYRSVADFIDETAVVPPVNKAIRQVAGPTAGITLTEDHFFDAEGRIERSEARSSTGVLVTSNYAGWDYAGRPTQVTYASSFRVFTYELAYNESELTMTQTPVSGGGERCVWSFSQIGETTTSTCDTAAGSFSSTATSTGTATVCR